jgi:3-hydroxymyristoyl/3-hydroxydecanoyl-(acyl carrier protein) dehydratase
VPGSCERRFAADHPAGDGHFPGNPVIPGALLLDEIVRAIAGRGAATPFEIRVAKFQAPVRPGDKIRIDWQESRGDTQFRCTLLDSNTIAVTGTLRLNLAPA